MIDTSFHFLKLGNPRNAAFCKILKSNAQMQYGFICLSQNVDVLYIFGSLLPGECEFQRKPDILNWYAVNQLFLLRESKDSGILESLTLRQGKFSLANTRDSIIYRPGGLSRFADRELLVGP